MNNDGSLGPPPGLVSGRGRSAAMRRLLESQGRNLSSLTGNTQSSVTSQTDTASVLSTSGCDDTQSTASSFSQSDRMRRLMNKCRSINDSGISDTQSEVPSVVPTVPKGRAQFLAKLLQKSQNIGAQQTHTVNADHNRPSPVSHIQSRLDTMSLSDTSHSAAAGSDRGAYQVDTRPHTKVTSPAYQDTRPAVPLCTNHIVVRANPGRYVYEYVLDFQPKQESMRLRFRLLASTAVRDVIGAASCHDGSLFYLPFKLHNEVTSVEVPHTYSRGDSTVRVIFKYKKQLRLHECNHVMNVCMKRIMQRLNLTSIRRAYYDSSAGRQLAGAHRMQVWPGFITAIHCYDGGMRLNVEVSHKLLHTTTVLTLIKEAFHVSSNNWQDIVFKKVIGEIVMTHYNKRTYRIDDIDYNMTPRSCFTLKDGREITYYDYYQQNHGIEITELDQPLLISRPKRRSIIEKNVDPDIKLVPELCHMTGLTDDQRNDFRLMKDLANQTAVKPRDRMLHMETLIRRIKSSPEANQVLQEWGISLDDNCTQVDGRHIAPERLVFGNHKQCEPDSRDFSWDRAIKSCQVLTPVSLTRWVIVYLNRNEMMVKQFVNCLMQSYRTLGIQIGEPRFASTCNERTDTFVNETRNHIRQDLQMAVVIMPSQRDDRYAAIKRLCYVDNPVHNQVVNFKTINKDAVKLRSIVLKIALQMNCKLGGELWTLSSPVHSTMVCGIDVFHDKPGGSRNSVLAFVSTLNIDQSRYYSQCRINKVGQEIGDSFNSCMISSIRQWFDNNRTLPRNIVVFRDGVGVGSLTKAIHFEIDQYKSAFETFNNFSPNLYVIVIHKRINTRIFDSGSQEPSNARPGTVLDHTVTLNDYVNFFLVSQHVSQGSVSPVHYIVAEAPSEGGWDPVRLQRLTYRACYLYFNWCGTVRVPAPVLYAHRLAYMVGQIIHRVPDERLASHLFYL